MEASNKDVIKAAGRIMVNTGIAGLTLDSLRQEGEIAGKRLPKEIVSESDLFELLFRDFERELKALVTGIAIKHKPPDKEIALLFKSLYDLFKYNQWYLDLVFDPAISVRCPKAEDIIFGVKRVARNYLTRLIQRGKREEMFATTENTWVLVDEILESFRAMMNDWQLTEKMIKDIKQAQTVKD
ncbi:MAG: hypothetical protein KUL83_12375 [Lentimicrobium sp.]|nr:hypothetical protein [Lentimicrobium sp.]